MFGSLLCRWNLHHTWKATTSDEGTTTVRCARCDRYARRSDARAADEATRLRNRVSERVWSEVGPQP
jgi:hypothetical protein